VTAFSKYRLAG